MVDDPAPPITRIPQELRPSWRTIPRLSWTMARADAPAGPVTGFLSAMLIYAPIVVGAHVTGQLASLSANALMIVQLDSLPKRRLVRACAAAATAAIVWGVPGCVAWIVTSNVAVAVVRASGSHVLGAVVAQAAVVVFIAVPLLLVVSSRAVMCWSILPAYRADRAARACLAIPRSGLLTVAGFAAWPQRSGHGSALAERILPVIQAAAASTGRTVLVVARTPELALVYQRWGLRPFGPSEQVLIAGGPPAV